MNRNSYASEAQKDYIVHFLKENPALISGRKSDSLKEKIVDLWQTLTLHLNSLDGPPKTWKQWKKTWQDMKSRVRSKNHRIKNNNFAFPFTERDVKILDLFRLEVAPISGKESIKLVREEPNLNDPLYIPEDSFVTYDDNEDDISSDPMIPEITQELSSSSEEKRYSPNYTNGSQKFISLERGRLIVKKKHLQLLKKQNCMKRISLARKKIYCNEKLKLMEEHNLILRNINENLEKLLNK